MLNKLVNYFYRQFLLNIDALPQDEMFMLDIAATFLKN